MIAIAVSSYLIHKQKNQMAKGLENRAIKQNRKPRKNNLWPRTISGSIKREIDGPIKKSCWEYDYPYGERNQFDPCHTASIKINSK